MLPGEFQRSRAAVARVAHNHEVASSNLASATSLERFRAGYDSLLGRTTVAPHRQLLHQTHNVAKGGQVRLARPPVPFGIGRKAERAKRAATNIVLTPKAPDGARQMARRPVGLAVEAETRAGRACHWASCRCRPPP